MDAPLNDQKAIDANEKGGAAGCDEQPCDAEQQRVAGEKLQDDGTRARKGQGGADVRQEGAFIRQTRPLHSEFVPRLPSFMGTVLPNVLDCYQ
jgi:hypothetical protein